MQANTSCVQATLLDPAGIQTSQLTQWLDRLMTPGVEYADLYFQQNQSEAWVLENSCVRNASFNLDRGVGVRAVSGEKTGLAYSDQIQIQAIEQAIQAAASISRQGQHTRAALGTPQVNTPLYPGINPLDTLSPVEKVALLRHADQCARSADTRVTQVSASLSTQYEEVLVVGSDGTLATDIRPLVRFGISVVVENQGRRESGQAGGGGRFSLAYFSDQQIAEYAQEAVRSALVNLEAIATPAGEMPVVLGSGWPGILLHEAVGHGLEGDFNRKGSSTFSGRLGEQVASSLCTVVDDGTLKERRGSLTIDDEGTPSQHTVLIDSGKLVGYMQDKMNARLMGMQPTGNGRRESYAHMPMPRMTNTYMLPGEHSRDEMIASIKKGIYAANFAGGQVDITSGRFVFSASEAYLIEDGRITQPVKGATLTGNGPEVMQNISMVGQDLALDPGIGVCGKEGQGVPVGVGQPSIKVDHLIVGGTQGH
ncbi:TldD protein [Allopseudospirillum japonicum]|uniref:TldD protein n=1 Tax=Allopseudospirillum japonicum TaxID=64971 RepID=A0A1H6QDV3_9GAMM|nr:metalloprotease TldD [Allopseudospirillum japonicum]SEI41899.1 TldD protein [Allopseudospirillum japonicum]